MVDLSFLEKFTKGDSSRIRRYIKMYLQHSPAIFEQMSQNVQEQKWRDLAISTDFIKSQGELVGILELKNLLSQIEVKVLHNNYTEIGAIFKKTNDIHIESQTSLRNIIHNDYSVDEQV